jgi:hypothetical protein
MATFQACSVGNSLSNTRCCTYSFAASSGWDAVTGLGSPNFQAIANMVVKNPTFLPNNLGAHPAGSTASSNIVSGDDGGDEEAEAEALVAIVLAVVAFALAIAALALVLYRMATEEKKSYAQMNNALLSNCSNNDLT